jgi:hypothetical protein
VYRRVRKLVLELTQSIKFWTVHHDRNLLKRFDQGFSRHSNPNDALEQGADEILRRVALSYERAKGNQSQAQGAYSVGPMWEAIITRNFGDLLQLMKDGNTPDAVHLLEAFHRHRISLGAGGSFDDLLAFRGHPLYRYQFVNTWLSYLQVFESIGGGEEELAFSQVGDPLGMMTASGVIPLEAIRYHFWARRFQKLLKGVQRPLICEIGGGLGGQAFKTLTTLAVGTRYVLFDIPETLLVASYFLLRSFPERRILLYGERDLDEAALDDFDLILMPNFEIPKIPDSSVDLWFNSCSFSEMLKQTSEEYLRQIERSCRGLFLHVNHTVRFHWMDQGRECRNLPADQLIPDPKRFELVERTRRPFGRIEDKTFLHQHGAMHNVYLYGRKA